MILALLLQAAPPPARAPAPPPDRFLQRSWGHFSRSPAFRKPRERVDIATAAVDPVSHALFYSLRLTRTRAFQPDAVLWTDSRTCPAVRLAFAALRALPPPRPSVPGMGREPGSVMLDGIGYSLTMPALFAGGGSGQLVFTSNIGTPLAAWVDRSLTALEPCWSAVELHAG